MSRPGEARPTGARRRPASSRRVEARALRRVSRTPSSASGTGPVSRTRTAGRRRTPIAHGLRIAATARAPGSRAPKSSTGCTRMKRRSSRGSGARPMISVRHEKFGSCPALIESSASANAARGRARSSNLICPRRTPSSTSDSASITPRNDGSAASVPSSGCAAMICCVVRATSSVGANSKPARLKNGPPSGRRNGGTPPCCWRVAVPAWPSPLPPRRALCRRPPRRSRRRAAGTIWRSRSRAERHGRVRRDQVGGIGVDRDVPHRVDGCDDAEHRGRDDHPPRAGSARADHARNQQLAQLRLPFESFRMPLPCPDHRTFVRRPGWSAGRLSPAPRRGMIVPMGDALANCGSAMIGRARAGNSVGNSFGNSVGK